MVWSDRELMHECWIPDKTFPFHIILHANYAYCSQMLLHTAHWIYALYFFFFYLNHWLYQLIRQHYRYLCKLTLTTVLLPCKLWDMYIFLLYLYIILCLSIYNRFSAPPRFLCYRLCLFVCSTCTNTNPLYKCSWWIQSTL